MQHLVYCKCSINVLADIVTFANSLALEGKRGLEEVGSTGRGSSQMRAAEFHGVEEKDGGEQDGGCAALESIQEPPGKGWEGLVFERRSTSSMRGMNLEAISH